MKRIFCCALALLLTSCATQVTSIKSDQDKQLTENYGYLLLGVQTNSDLKELFINGPKNIKLTSQDIKRGTNYLLVDLEAGDYSLEKIKLDNYWRLDIDDTENWTFKISPDTISYVGHMEIKRASYWYGTSNVELVNRSSEAVEFLKKKFPNIYNKRTLNYGGPGEDSFVEFFQSLQGSPDE